MAYEFKRLVIDLQMGAIKHDSKWKKAYICYSMKVHRGTKNLPDFINPVITIGSFDGVHLGHQKIIERQIEEARSIGGDSLVLTFDPHPRKIIYPKDKSLQLLSTVDEKIELFSRFEIDHLIIVEFTVAFSQINADEYIETFLIEKFKPKKIIIGYDHKFGLNRKGDISYLKWFEKKGGFEVIEIPKQEIDELSISSTKIRNALNQKEMAKASKLMGHPYQLFGKVIRGEQIGKTLGFPTANLFIADKSKLIPAFGIYAAHTIIENETYEAMLYIGDRPTLDMINGRTIELNIFNFDRDIYGQEIQVEILEYVRSDIKFENLEQLKSQLQKDKEDSIRILENYSKTKIQS